MKNIKYISLFILLVFVGSSCEDYLTKTIEFEELGFEPLIVVNAKITDSVEFLNVSISKNVNYANNSNSEYEFIDGATVTIDIDGQEFQTTELTEAEEFTDIYNHILNFPPDFIVSGKEYKIEVSHPDYKTVTSTTQIAQESEIADIDFEEEARTTFMFGYEFTEDRTSFVINDQSSETNYYRIQINIDDFGVFTNSDDPTIEPSNSGYILLSDEDFIDGSKELELYSENATWYGEEVKSLEVRNISRSEYLFLESYANYQNSQDFGFFAEPVTLYSNIENGLGIFSAEQINTYEL
jgi:hypothetical protein